MNSIPLTAELFLSEVFDYQPEAFDMFQLMKDDSLVGGVSPDPALPNLISLDLTQPFLRCTMYTNNLSILAAPRELCIRWALDLISSRMNYELNLSVLRLELMGETIGSKGGEREVEAVIKGIRCLSDWLLEKFDHCLRSPSDFFPYEYYNLHQQRYLFLTKLTVDANLPALTPTAVARSTDTYPSLFSQNRKTYTPQADQCIVL